MALHAEGEDDLRRMMGQQEQKIVELESHVRKLQAEKDSLMTNMSALMNKQMSQDESDLENINVKNRPMKIMDDFSIFCSQEWLEAKSALDDFVEDRGKDEDISEKTRMQLLLDVMSKCYEFAETRLEDLQNHFRDMLENPFQEPIMKIANVESLTRDDSTKSIKHSKKMSLEKDFKVSIAKYLKISSDNLDFTQFAEKLAVVILRQNADLGIDTEFATNTENLDFIQNCLKLCWNMVIQQPPMTFKCDPGAGGKYDEVKHEPHYSSADPKNPEAVVDYYVHPSLYHGAKQMKKARLVLRIPQKTDAEKETRDSKPNEPSDRTQTDETPRKSLFDGEVAYGATRGRDNLKRRSDEKLQGQESKFSKTGDREGDSNPSHWKGSHEIGSDSKLSVSSSGSIASLPHVRKPKLRARRKGKGEQRHRHMNST